MNLAVSQIDRHAGGGVAKSPGMTGVSAGCFRFHVGGVMGGKFWTLGMTDHAVIVCGAG